MNNEATRLAFETPWELCTPEQRALREAHLPPRTDNARADYEAETVRRYQAGEPLSIDGRKLARRLLKQRKCAAEGLNYA